MREWNGRYRDDQRGGLRGSSAAKEEESPMMLNESTMMKQGQQGQGGVTDESLINLY